MTPYTKIRFQTSKKKFYNNLTSPLKSSLTHYAFRQKNSLSNELLGRSAYCLSFFPGIKGDRFTEYIVQSYYGV